ncbi:hypothetical protein Purlil1_377 [Purpureocillium lilacinum]|uniref:Uncharacterized protein n=1 Tax=Purpureocillium lilacinum TaxID=33203 RepID=A0ABR0CIC8_PURLI|nr:hypothetical protein Purlil1_377 [Purpureocillium lilacinum]
MAPREKNATRGSIDLTANALLKSLVANAPATRIQFQSSQLNVSAQLMSQIPAAPSPQRPSLLPMPETVPGQTRRGGAVSGREPTAFLGQRAWAGDTSLITTRFNRLPPGILQ